MNIKNVCSQIALFLTLCVKNCEDLLLRSKMLRRMWVKVGFSKCDTNEVFPVTSVRFKQGHMEACYLTYYIKFFLIKRNYGALSNVLKFG